MIVGCFKIVIWCCVGWWLLFLVFEFGLVEFGWRVGCLGMCLVFAGGAFLTRGLLDLLISLCLLDCADFVVL